jgi:effector-binding domain-containing protein
MSDQIKTLLRTMGVLNDKLRYAIGESERIALSHELSDLATQIENLKQGGIQQMRTFRVTDTHHQTIDRCDEMTFEEACGTARAMSRGNENRNPKILMIKEMPSEIVTAIYHNGVEYAPQLKKD